MGWYYIVIDVTAIHNELEIQLSNFCSKILRLHSAFLHLRRASRLYLYLYVSSFFCGVTDLELFFFATPRHFTYSLTYSSSSILLLLLD